MPTTSLQTKSESVIVGSHIQRLLCNGFALSGRERKKNQKNNGDEMGKAKGNYTKSDVKNEQMDTTKDRERKHI